MCNMLCEIEGGIEALRESDGKNYLKPNSQSRNLNIYVKHSIAFIANFAAAINLKISSHDIHVCFSFNQMFDDDVNVVLGLPGLVLHQ